MFRETGLSAVKELVAPFEGFEIVGAEVVDTPPRSFRAPRCRLCGTRRALPTSADPTGEAPATRRRVEIHFDPGGARAGCFTVGAR